MTDQMDDGTWKVLFTMELDVEQGRYRLGGFLCFYWPAAYAKPGGNKVHEATLVMLKAAGADPRDTGLPDMMEVSKFIQYANMRNTLDNKATPALVLGVPQQLTRDQMEALIDSVDREGLHRWRKECQFKTRHWGVRMEQPTTRSKQK